MSLLTWLAVACLAAAAAVAGRWTARRVDPLGRPRGFPAWTCMGLVVLALVCAIPGAQRRMQERRLESVATRLVGHSVQVRCQTNAAAFVDAGAELGYVKYDANGVPEAATLLKTEPCRALRSYTDSDKERPSLQEVVAVHVLTHEAMHMRGETSEAATECQAVQRNALTARMLGASEPAARRLARTYWLVVYPDMPDEYRTPDCAPGQALDEGLVSAPWASP